MAQNASMQFYRQCTKDKPIWIDIESTFTWKLHWIEECREGKRKSVIEIECSIKLLILLDIIISVVLKKSVYSRSMCMYLLSPWRSIFVFLFRAQIKCEIFCFVWIETHLENKREMIMLKGCEGETNKIQTVSPEIKTFLIFKLNWFMFSGYGYWVLGDVITRKSTRGET